MKVIDSRSGREVKVGDVVEYPDGEYLRLIDVDQGFFWASAIVEYGYIDHTQDVLELEPLAKVISMSGSVIESAPIYRVVKRGPIIKTKREIPLIVRWLHPAFRFQHVAFIPS